MSCILCGGSRGDCSCSDTAVEVYRLHNMLEAKLTEISTSLMFLSRAARIKEQEDEQMEKLLKELEAAK